MNIAHCFTLLRIIIIPFFSVFYLRYQWFHVDIIFLPYILFCILAFCEFTDLIDGFLARKKNQVTELGKILDPMADSITRIAVLFTFTQGWVSIPLLLVFVFLYREGLISSLRTICALKGFALAARKSGKIKAFIQAIVSFFIVLLMIPFTMGYISLEMLQKLSLFSVSFAAFYSILTAIEYIYVNRKYIKKIIVS